MNISQNDMATLGGGCFWCLEAAYKELRGIERVVSGYAGGKVPHPTYAQVCTGATGHAEVVQLTYDPNIITYKDILDVFFTIHDPTTPNRQGYDVGTQYRSIVLYHDPEQRAVTEQAIEYLTSAKVWDNPIVTQIEPLTEFYAAEEYHQDYFEKNPEQPYCQAIVAPKVAKARKHALAKVQA